MESIWGRHLAAIRRKGRRKIVNGRRRFTYIYWGEFEQDGQDEQDEAVHQGYRGEEKQRNGTADGRGWTRIVWERTWQKG
jgi:hypothetical protein